RFLPPVLRHTTEKTDMDAVKGLSFDDTTVYSEYFMIDGNKWGLCPPISAFTRRFIGASHCGGAPARKSATASRLETYSVILILWMPLNVNANVRAHRVDLIAIRLGPVERVFRDDRRDPLSLIGGWNAGVVHRHRLAADPVVDLRHATAEVDLEALAFGQMDRLERFDVHGCHCSCLIFI